LTGSGNKGRQTMQAGNCRCLSSCQHYFPESLSGEKYFSLVCDAV
jgi:hypothetical protein